MEKRQHTEDWGFVKDKEMGIHSYSFLGIHLGCRLDRGGAGCRQGIQHMAFDEWSVVRYWPSIVPSDYFRKNLSPVRNMFENRSSVQTNHRMLAYMTYATTMAACLLGLKRRQHLPKTVLRALAVTAAFVNLQVVSYHKAFSGITTVLRGAPPHDALVHLTNGMLLLTAMLYLLHTLKRPNKKVLAAILRYRSAIKN